MIQRYFSCGFAHDFCQHFEVYDEEREPLFGMGFNRLYQAKPLKLQSRNTEKAVMEQRRVCDEQLKALGPKKLLKHSAMEAASKKVHHALLKKLHYLKRRGVDSILTYSLNELMPMTAEQLKLMLELDMLLDDGSELSVKLKRRAHTRPGLIKFRDAFNIK